MLPSRPRHLLRGAHEEPAIAGVGPSRDTVALKKIDDSTIEVTNKKACTITTRMRIAVAPDGKTRTNTVQGTDAAASHSRR